MTPNNGESPGDRVRAYRSVAIHYMRNAHEFLSRRDFANASEFLWGAVSQSVKAVAALQGGELRQHRQLWDFARELARELDDPDLFQNFRQANSMHSNFYEAGLPAEEVIDSIGSIGAAVSKLLDLLPQEAGEESD
jgi:hypothetical protein